MPTIEVQIEGHLNKSVQAGDTAHFAKLNSVNNGGFTTATGSNAIFQAGVIKEIRHVFSQPSYPGYVSDDWDTWPNYQIGDDNWSWNLSSYNFVIDIPAGGNIPIDNDFLMFSKSAAANEFSAMGYYGKFVFKNNSRGKAELFSAACEIVESSK
tara:strand:+ start:2893 stop:3354 length:462 start_codon:yes stop_codon:yes gene_type:complete